MTGMLQSGDKAMTLCFVEFVDSKCALTALEALQGICLFWIAYNSVLYPCTVLRNVNVGW